MRKGGKREVHYPVVLAVRLDTQTAAHLERAAEERGTDRGQLGRAMIQHSLGHIGQISPVRRTRSTVNAEQLGQLLHMMGATGGNLQRLYTYRLSTGVDDAELLQLKREFAAIAASVRATLGGERDP